MTATPATWSDSAFGLEVRTAAGVLRGSREAGLAVFRGVPYAEVANEGGSATGAWGLAPINDGQWHHIAGTFDGTLSNRNTKYGLASMACSARSMPTSNPPAAAPAL